jgi:hypothetical protein
VVDQNPDKVFGPWRIKPSGLTVNPLLTSANKIFRGCLLQSFEKNHPRKRVKNAFKTDLQTNHRHPKSSSPCPPQAQ